MTILFALILTSGPPAITTEYARKRDHSVRFRRTLDTVWSMGAFCLDALGLRPASALALAQPQARPQGRPRAGDRRLSSS
jgi:hypothetical protein